MQTIQVNHSRRNSLTYLFGAIAALALSIVTSCGGGGGAAITPPVDNTPAPGTSNIAGQLVQGAGGKATSAAGDSLAGILVQLINIGNGQLAGTAVTDIAGKYEFKGIPAGEKYLLKVEFTTSQDLNGDGQLDKVELTLPLNPTDQQTLSLLQQLGVTDSNNDGVLDAIQFENEISDSTGHVENHDSEHRLNDGQTVVDANGNGSFSDDTPFADANCDGVPDDNGGAGGGGNSGGGDGGITEKSARGAITALSVDRITLGDVSFLITDATQWFGSAGQLTAAQFSVGQLVEVEGLSDGNGGFTALKVKLEDGTSSGGGDNGGGMPNERLAKGAITSLSVDRVAIGDASFLINADTLWFDAAGTASTPDQFSVGQTVEIEGKSDSNGGWIALKVKIEDAGSGGGDNGGGGTTPDKTSTGAITSLSPDRIFIGDASFLLTADTLWFDLAGGASTKDQFSVGQTVEVEGTSDGNGGWVATKVKLEDGGGNGGGGTTPDKTAMGAITALSVDRIFIGDVSFKITADTKWFDASGAPSTPSLFAIGQTVEVEGTSDGNGGWIATKVKLDDAGSGGGNGGGGNGGGGNG